MITKPNLIDFQSENLILYKNEEENLQKGENQIQNNVFVKGGSLDCLIEWLTFPKSTSHEVIFYILFF